MKKTFDFLPFDSTRLDATCAQWGQDAEQDYAFPGIIEEHLDWVKSHIRHVDGEGVAYGVFDSPTGPAFATCTCIYRKTNVRTMWVKLLDLRLRPELENRLEDRDVHALRLALDVYIEAVLGVIRLKTDTKASTMKIYGRDSAQLMFLQQLAAELEANNSFQSVHRCKIEGRWLVIADF